jgi:hypothetical protein
MTMLSPILLSALMAGATPAAIQVDVGHANWASMPRIERVDRQLPTPPMIDRVQALLGSKCRLPGQRRSRFNITIPYAVLVNPDGSASHVVVGETGCADLESYVGLIVLELARNGDFRPSGGPAPRWMSSEINFNLD